MHIRFVNFLNLDKDTLLTVLKWRNRDDIRVKMINQEIISESSHLKFCLSLKDRKDCIYYMALVDGVPSGVINYVKLNYEELSGEYGLYSIDTRPGIGAVLGQIAITNYFETLKFKTLNIEVLENNLNAKQYNEVCLGFKDPVFIADEYQILNDKIGAFHYVMTDKDWNLNIKSRYERTMKRLSYVFED
jgi:UDP-4-amino-4,6-dideoxy-N-acetyl-beta-L-altrosamine N-acetyltransferase